MAIAISCWLRQVVLALAGSAFASAAAASTHWSRPATSRGFVIVRPELQRLANEEGRRHVNHFCAVVQDVREPPSATSEGDRRVLIVHWREGRRIDSYGPAPSGRIGAEQADAGASIDLAHDVIDTDAQVDGSIKRVTRAYVSGLIAHCRDDGTTYVVLRGKRRQ